MYQGASHLCLLLCFLLGKSSAQLSQVSLQGEDCELQEGKVEQEREEDQDLRLCLVILAQCRGSLHHPPYRSRSLVL